MKTFLIQTYDNKIEHEFSFHLKKAIEYHNWFYNYKVYDYVLSDSIILEADYIPVGSLEFVFEYLRKYYNKTNINPINIPLQLRKHEFLKRNVAFTNRDNIVMTDRKFVKSNTTYKSFVDIISNTSNLHQDNYLVSDVVEIDSEWRAFIHQNTLVDIKNYAGSFKLFPDIQFIEKMIREYDNCPISYTMDIGINDSGCFLIEVHPFVSCGLYGFADYKILPQMFIQGFNHILNG